jgi:hypothetical protein
MVMAKHKIRKRDDDEDDDAPDDDAPVHKAAAHETTAHGHGHAPTHGHVPTHGHTPPHAARTLPPQPSGPPVAPTPLNPPGTVQRPPINNGTVVYVEGMWVVLNHDSITERLGGTSLVVTLNGTTVPLSAVSNGDRISNAAFHQLGHLNRLDLLRP